MIISGEIGYHWVEIDTEKCHMIVCHPIADVIVMDDTFDNLIILSEFFRDIVGDGPAKDFLEEHKVPKDSMMWKLGSKG